MSEPLMPATHPGNSPGAVTLSLPDAAATAQVGAVIARALGELAREVPVVVCLEGELGAGKTTLARGLLRALGHAGRVPSPTYTLIEPYELDGLPVHHLDLYRLADEEELLFLGASDWLDRPGLTLVEWPERAPGLLARADLRLMLALAGEGRSLTLHAASVRMDAVVAAVTDALERDGT